MSRIDAISGYSESHRPSEAIFSSFKSQIELHEHVLLSDPNGPNSHRAKYELENIKNDILYFIESGFSGLGPLLQHQAFKRLH